MNTPLPGNWPCHLCKFNELDGREHPCLLCFTGDIYERKVNFVPELKLVKAAIAAPSYLFFHFGPGEILKLTAYFSNSKTPLLFGKE